MKKPIAILLLLCVSMLACTNKKDNQRTALSAEQLKQELTGGWDIINSTGSSEQWYFDKSGNYFLLNKQGMRRGTWQLNDKDIVLDNEAPQAIRMEGEVLRIGNRNLQRAPSVASTIGEQLSTQLTGTWAGADGSNYTFFEGGYYVSKYESDDGLTFDGSWKLDGNSLILDDDKLRADPIHFEGNTLKWGIDSFTRQGDAPANARPNIATTGKGAGPSGAPIAQHTFAAKLGSFGDVTVAPYTERSGNSADLKLYLTKNGKSVYSFPNIPMNEWAAFDGIQALAAKDINGDNRKDIILMADYIQTNAEGDLNPIQYNAVFVNKGKSFSLDKALNDKIQAQNDLNSINDIIAFAGTTSKSSGSTKKAGSSSYYSRYAKDRSICRIRLAAVKNLDYTVFSKVKDLGMLVAEPSDLGLTRVYLGKYIGKATAYRVLQQVKRKGFPNAYIIVDQDYIEEKPKEEPPFYTYQIAAVKKLDLDKLAQLNDQYQNDVYISYGDNRYRISLGVFQKELYPYLESEFKNMAARIGYGGGFSKVIK